MATSGETNFSLDRDTLIKDSLVDIGAISSEDTPSSVVVEHASRLLNMMLKAWMADGLHLWKIRPFSIVLEADKISYNLYSSGDQATLSLNYTTIRTDEALGQSSIEVTTTSGMTAGDYICIEQDDDTLHKTTIASVTDGDTVVITNVTTDEASAGNRVYWYTDKIPRVMDVSNITVKDSDDYERPVTIVSRQEYFTLTTKNTEGDIVQVYFDPGTTIPKLYVYNVPTTSNETMELVGYFPIEDMDAAANDFDIPQEWYLAAKTGLSVLLGPSYGARTEQMKHLKLIADEEKQRVMGWDKEKTSVFLIPDVGGR